VHENSLRRNIEVSHVCIAMYDDTEYDYLKNSLCFNNLYYLFILCHMKLVLWGEKF
jgi:hypothetical protein